jgi:hypothetical protein
MVLFDPVRTGIKHKVICKSLAKPYIVLLNSYTIHTFVLCRYYGRKVVSMKIKTDFAVVCVSEKSNWKLRGVHCPFLVLNCVELVPNHKSIANVYNKLSIGETN